MPHLEANGIRFYYELHGPPDGEPLILSNGVLMSTASWAYQTPVLAQHYRLLLYDCRGMWQSDHPPGPYSMELHAGDLAAMLDALQIERAHIGGISYGGEISMAFALKYPQRTRSLIVASAVSHLEVELVRITESWLEAAEARDPERFYQVTYPYNFSEAWMAANQEAVEAARQRYRALDLQAMVELLKCFARLDLRAGLGRIQAPTLVMVGEEDRLKPRKYAEIIVAGIPNSEYALIPHAGHAVLWEKAGVFNSLILGFLAKQREGNGS